MAGRLVTACVLDVLVVLDASVEDVCVAGVWLTIRAMVAILLSPPPVPVTVKVNEPGVTPGGSRIVSVETKLGIPEAGLKAPVEPEGNPVTDNAIIELNPFRGAAFTEYETACPCSPL